MSKCPTNEDGQHGFMRVLAPPSENQEFDSFLTCISCGERRALTKGGVLVVFNKKDDLWEKV